MIVHATPGFQGVSPPDSPPSRGHGIVTPSGLVLNRLLRHIATRTLHATGGYSLLRRLDGRSGRRLVILMYHDIRDASAPPSGDDGDSPTATQFAAHMDLLRRHFRIVSLSRAVEEIESGGLSHDAAAVTFDDGYASVHRNALPVLASRGIPATLFVLGGLLDGRRFWWHDLRSMIRRAAPERLREAVTRLGWGAAPDRDTFVRVAEDHLRDRSGDDRRQAIDRLAALLEWDGTHEPAVCEPLNWEQVRDLHGHGVEIAAHTMSHRNFRYIDEETAAREIRESMRAIEEHTGSPVTGFAYPYGKDVAHYRRFEPLLRQCGIRYACTAVPGNNRGRRDLLLLRRFVLPATASRARIDHSLFRAFTRDDGEDT